MTAIAPTQSLSQIMSDIDLGPTGSIQFMFAKLQLAQSQLCKNQAEDYMKQVQDIQTEQKKCSEMIAKARELQQASSDKVATEMPEDMRTFFAERGLKWDQTGGETDYKHNKNEWDYNLKSITNYQEQVGNKTQTIMVYLQDFMGQYNSYLQGANSAISKSNDVLSAIAQGR